MLDLGFGELLVIAAGALLLFGPDRLPQLGRALGKALSGFHEGLREARGLLDKDDRPAG